MKQALIMKHVVEFKPNFDFSQRESAINNEASNIMQTLRKRGFYPLGFDVTNKNDRTATITVRYNI